MPFPDEPCAACPRVARGLPMPCRAQVTKHARYCTHAAEGNQGYIGLLCEDPPPQEFPPLVEQAGNLIGAMGLFVASGGKTATPEQQAERMAVCRGCPEFKDGRCRRCGCFLMAKIASEAEHCPLDPPKW